MGERTSKYCLPSHKTFLFMCFVMLLALPFTDFLKAFSDVRPKSSIIDVFSKWKIGSDKYSKSFIFPKQILYNERFMGLASFPSDSSHTMPPQTTEDGTHQGLPTDGGGIYQEPGATEATRGETGRREVKGG